MRYTYEDFVLYVLWGAQPIKVKSMKTKYKNMKIRTYGSEELSTAIQKKLIELGYRWSCLGATVAYTDKPYLFTAAEGHMGFAAISSTFDGCEEPEVTIDELMQMEPRKRETLKIGENEYDKAEIEELLKDIKPVK